MSFPRGGKVQGKGFKRGSGNLFGVCRGSCRICSGGGRGVDGGGVVWQKDFCSGVVGIVGIVY